MRKPFIILMLSITVLAFAESCKSKGMVRHHGGRGGRGGCDCPSIGRH